jgi:putative DNA primase/helicase
MTALEIARSLGGACRSGRWWRCRCPVHSSRGPTLALRDGEHGVIAYCHAGCSQGDVLIELQRHGLLGRTTAANPPARESDRARARDLDLGRATAAHPIWDAAQAAGATPLTSYLAGRGIGHRPATRAALCAGAASSRRRLSTGDRSPGRRCRRTADRSATQHFGSRLL